jgi:glucose/arabinose dehydrogenase
LDLAGVSGQQGVDERAELYRTGHQGAPFEPRVREQVVDEERLLKDLQPMPERIRDVEQGPEGAIYLMTDSPQGRLVKLVPKK